MTDMELFHYHRGNTFIHRLHPVIKVLSLLLLCVSITVQELPGALALLLLIGSGYAAAGSTAALSLLKKRGVLLLLAALFLAALFTETRETSLPEALLPALLLIIRFCLLLFTGHLFTATTSPGNLEKGIASLLFFLPGDGARKIGSRIRLFFTLLPLFFQQYAQISQAHRARGLGMRKPFVSRVILGSGNFILLVFLSAEGFSDALDSRGWDISPPGNKGLFTGDKPVPADWFFFLFLLLFNIAITVLSRYI